MKPFAQHRVSDAEAECVADDLVGPPVDSHVSRAYRVDHEALVGHRHPKLVTSTEYHQPRRILVVGKRLRP